MKEMYKSPELEVLCLTPAEELIDFDTLRPGSFTQGGVEIEIPLKYDKVKRRIFGSHLCPAAIAAGHFLPFAPHKSQFIGRMPSPGGRCPEGADEGITKPRNY